MKYRRGRAVRGRRRRHDALGADSLQVPRDRSLASLNPLQARIEAAAVVTGKSVDAILSHLEEVVASVIDVEVATNADATAVGVSVGLLEAPHLETRMRNLSNAISGSEALVRTAAARGSRVMRVERGLGPQGRGTRGLAGAFSTVHHLEPRKVEDDVATARDAGLPPAVADELAAHAERLGITSTTFRVTVYAGPPGQNMQIELGGSPPGDFWDRLEDTGEVGRFLRTLQPRGATLVWLGATPTGLLPWRRVELLHPDLDEAVAIAGKFGGEMGRARSFIPAAETRTIASLSVTLGTSPRGPVWLSTNVSA